MRKPITRTRIKGKPLNISKGSKSSKIKGKTKRLIVKKSGKNKKQNKV